MTDEPGAFIVDIVKYYHDGESECLPCGAYTNREAAIKSIEDWVDRNGKDCEIRWIPEHRGCLVIKSDGMVELAINEYLLRDTWRPIHRFE